MTSAIETCDVCGEPWPECLCYDDPDYQHDCHYCGGDGWVDGTEEDALWHGFDHPMIDCPCCGGSGQAKDCRFW